ncbi:uncharacterized protein N7484_002377 [Penicillium longicatenatum]|uniref:uncharacterized protein n=1 Tax=Penicillium longicatenatum TaxID=1561947 RepID=UPI0025470CA3|nr:uncharacterized protein N7484_002377 [Penicillium longicatenatum]KAJ5658728.1 hypothetical protein N7484_002377 [Penicillium longicatenatum]
MAIDARFPFTSLLSFLIRVSVVVAEIWQARGEGHSGESVVPHGNGSSPSAVSGYPLLSAASSNTKRIDTFHLLDLRKIELVFISVW